MFRIVHYDLPRDIMEGRLMKRMEETPVELRRKDDNPETMIDRMNTFFKTSMEGIDFYKKFGLVRVISALGSPDEVFKATIAGFKPVVITVTGATNLGKTTFAKKLAGHLDYSFIDCEIFFKHRGLRGTEEQVMALSEFLEEAPYRKFVLDNFPTTKRQAKIFYKTYDAPFAIFDITAEKDVVYDRIYQTHSEENIEKVKARFQKYLEEKDALLDFHSSLETGYFKLDGTCSTEKLFKTAMKCIFPQFLVANTKENPELGQSLLSQLEEKENYMNLDFEVLIESEKRRGTKLGERLALEWTPELVFPFLRKVFFQDPSQNNKFILSNFPNDLKFLQRLYEEVCPFSKVLYFTNNEGGTAATESQNFSSEWVDIVGHYYSKNMLVAIGADNVDQILFYLEKRNKYGILVGGTNTGKTVIAKSLYKKKLVNLIRLEKYKERLIKRLSTDDEPKDEVSYEEVLHHLNLDMQSAPEDQVFLLDDFPFVDGGLDKVMKAVGPPLFVLKMSADAELLLSRFRKKNNMGEEDEFSAEDKELYAQSQQNLNQINDRIEDLREESPLITIYEIDVSAAEKKTLEVVGQIFKKRIILTRCANKDLNQDRLLNRVSFLSARHGYQFISMQKVLEEVQSRNDYQVRNPHQVIDFIKQIAESNKTFSR